MEIPECQEFPQRKKNKTPKTQQKKKMNFFLFLQSRTNNKREKEASHRKREKTKGKKKTKTTNCRAVNGTQERNAKTFVKTDKVRERRRSSSSSGSLARPLARDGRRAGCAEREGGKGGAGRVENFISKSSERQVPT
jgi:hypothetical protein